MAKETSITEQLRNFEAGLYDRTDVRTQCAAGWYDWFCNESALPRKTKALYTKLKGIVNSGKFDPKKTYAFFKNNCPLNGPLYDDFRICDRTTGDVIYTVVPKCGHNGKAELWGKENGFQGPIVSFDTWKELKDWFNRKP